MTSKALKRHHYDSGPNMTPLVDVVMVILIFLMLTGSFGGLGHFLPGAPAVRQPHVAGPAHNPPDLSLLTLRVVSRDETFVVTSPDLGLDAAGQPVQFRDIESLRDALRDKRHAKELAGLRTEDLRVLIAPAAATKFDHVMHVYEAVLAARWPKCGFGTAE